AHTVADLAHRVARTAERPGDLAQSSSFRQPAPDLLKPPHRHAAYPHIVNSFVWTHEGSRIGSGGRGYRQPAAATMAAVAPEEINENLIIGGPLAPSGRFQKRSAGGPQLRKSGGPELRKSGGLQPRKLGGPQHRKSCKQGCGRGRATRGTAAKRHPATHR